jgi:RND superfamily putative drug exporter
MTLIPAFMTLIGEKTWYIPRWLDKILPDITIEPPHDGDECSADPRPARARRRLDDDFSGRRV